MKKVSLNTEKQLIKKLNKDNILAFNQLFEFYSSKLYHFAYGYLKSKEDAEELVQETFCRIWEKRKEIKAEYEFRSYLFTIAFNDIRKHFRSKALLQKYVEYTAKAPDGQAYEQIDINYASLKDLIDSLIDKMPEKRKAVFMKSRFEGKSTTDIAEEMKISKSTVENHMNLALRYLKNNLERETIGVSLFFCLFLQ